MLVIAKYTIELTVNGKTAIFEKFTPEIIDKELIRIDKICRQTDSIERAYEWFKDVGEWAVSEKIMKRLFSKKKYFYYHYGERIVQEGDRVALTGEYQTVNLSLKELLKIKDIPKVIAYLKQEGLDISETLK